MMKSERLSDLPNRGRSITATSKHNIAAAKAVIEENPYVTFDEIVLEKSFSRDTIYCITISTCVNNLKVGPPQVD